jgi:hypothetical protein
MTNLVPTRGVRSGRYGRRAGLTSRLQPDSTSFTNLSQSVKAIRDLATEHNELRCRLEVLQADGIWSGREYAELCEALAVVGGALNNLQGVLDNSQQNRPVTASLCQGAQKRNRQDCTTCREGVTHDIRED